MALLLPRGHQVFPEPTPELLLSRSGRLIGNLVLGSVALCTMALDAPVGQEGVGTADQRQGCHGRPGGAMLVVTEPQQRLPVVQPRLDGMISNDTFCCTRWGVLQLSWWRRPNRLRR